MKVSGYQCDVCKVVKGEANHWWIKLDQADAFLLIPWHDGDADLERVIQHLCGEQCVAKSLSQWMKGQQKAVATCNS